MVEDDLRGKVPGAGWLRGAYEQAVGTERTSQTWSDWRDEQVEQAAVGWVLGTVFVRFCEDNDLIDQPWIAGPGDRADTAAQAQTAYQLRLAQVQHGRRWLRGAFGHLAEVGATAALFDADDPVWRWDISVDAAAALLDFWRRGADRHDFTDPDLDTRFLGDLYENLSTKARKRYALLRTPEFVAEFILDLTMSPAIEEFGHDEVRMIDPVCGSGQFVLGAFDRLVRAWAVKAPGLPREQRVQNTLAAVHGVDVNRSATAITRFRLLVAALRASGLSTLAATSGRAWTFNIVVGDSLLDAGPLLSPGRYHVVVGNPPYLTVANGRLDQHYRERYDACVGRYSLIVPFTQRFYELARRAEPGDSHAGYVGQLTANSFMKREFGRKLTEEFLAQRVTLTHVIDTSGAYIPGHGTPTAILVGRNRRPDQNEPVLAVIARRGEPAVPADPAQGIVWQSLQRHARRAGQVDEWNESHLLERGRLRSFPWNLASAATAELLRDIASQYRLRDWAVRIGYFGITGSDDVFTAPAHEFRRLGAEPNVLVDVITGSDVRDWSAVPQSKAFFPRKRGLRVVSPKQYPQHLYRLWPYRTALGLRRNYSGRSYFADRRRWYDWHSVTDPGGVDSLSIVFAWVATHCHFAVLRGGAAPLHSAPVIELHEWADLDVHVDLTGLLNSSAVCFWLKQNSNSKGRPRADQTGSGEAWAEIYEFTGTRLGDLPIPEALPSDRARRLDCLARELDTLVPRSVVATERPERQRLAAAHEQWAAVQAEMVALQEELDWEVYGHYGLVPDDDRLLAPPELVPPLRPGERAFEIVLARGQAAGELHTTWFSRHDLVPVAEPPVHWPASYRDTVLRRIAAIESESRVGLIERPEFKRRWTMTDWPTMQTSALREWILDQCERTSLWYVGTGNSRRPHPLTVQQLADLLSTDDTVVEAVQLLADGRSLGDVIAEILAEEHVPSLPALRYSDSGLRKHAAWEEVWRLQRAEDTARSADDAAADRIRDGIPAGPRFVSADFAKLDYWRHRGKYDVPRERFVSYPHASVSDKKRLLIGWAGWTRAEQAQVLTDLINDYVDPGDGDLLVALLANLREVLASARQGEDNLTRARAGEPDVCWRRLLTEWLQRLDLTEADLVNWRPPRPRRGRPRRS
jgi:hypothetical protein